MISIFVYRFNVLIQSVLALAILLCSVSALGSFEPRLGRDPTVQEIRVYLKNFQSDLPYLRELGFDVAGFDIKNQAVSIITGARGREFLQKDGFQITVLSTLSDSSRAGSLYLNPERVADRLLQLSERYPQLAQLEVLGQSVERRTLYALKISDNPQLNDPEEPKVMFNALHHAREVMTPEIAIDTAEYLLTNYGKDPKVTRWVNETEIWIIPMVNPDGSQKVWNGDTYWRKNVRDGSGVDINRNYPYRWGQCRGSSDSPTSDSYRGPESNSEPESMALMALVEQIQPVVNISYHSFGEMVIYPFGCGKDQETSDRYAELEALGQMMAKALPRESGSGTYKAGPIHSTVYPVDGDDVDWMYLQHGVLAYGFEINRSFQPNYETHRQSTVEKLRAAWSLAIERSLSSGIRVVIHDYNPYVSAPLRIQIKDVQSGETSERWLHYDGSAHFSLPPNRSYTLTILRESDMIFQTETKTQAALTRMTMATPSPTRLGPPHDHLRL